MTFSVNNKKIARNTVALYVRTIITMIISFFTARVTLQILGVEDYGLNNLVGSVVALFSFLNASMGTAVQRFFNIEIGKSNVEKLGRVYGVGLYLHIIVAVITIIVAEIFAFFYLNKMNIPSERMLAAHVVFQISSLSMALNIVNVPNYALLKAREMFDKMAMVDIVQALLRLAVLYFLYIISYDKLIVFSTLNLGVTFYYVASLFVLARKFPESHTCPCRDKELAREMLKFISLLIITVLAEIGRKQGLVILINLFFGLAINAAYAIAVQISSMVNTFVLNIKQPMVPQMMAAYGAGDKDAMFNLINYGTKITAMLLLIITLPIIYEIDYLLELWLTTPPNYTSGLVKLVLVNINISSFTYYLYQGVHATGNISRQQIWMSSFYVMNILLIYLFFKLGFSFYYALYITIFISLCQSAINLIMAHKYYSFNFYFFLRDSLMPCLLIAGIISIVMYGIQQIISISIWRVFLIGFVCFALCVLLGFLILLNKVEKTKAIAFAKSIVKNKSLSNE